MQSLMDSKTLFKRDSMDQGLLVCARCCSFYGFADARAVEFRNHPVSCGGSFKHEYALFKSVLFRLFNFQTNPFSSLPCRRIQMNGTFQITRIFQNQMMSFILLRKPRPIRQDARTIFCQDYFQCAVYAMRAVYLS